MADNADTTTQRFVETPEYRRIVYRWMRQEIRMPHAGGRISKWSAQLAWKRSGEWMEALRYPL
jgi:hypothetical protein